MEEYLINPESEITVRVVIDIPCELYSLLERLVSALEVEHELEDE
jgi:hypothetical protein